MKSNSALKWLIPLIFVLALVAALAGLWPGEGQHYYRFSELRAVARDKKPPAKRVGKNGYADEGGSLFDKNTIRTKASEKVEREWLVKNQDKATE